MICQSTSIPQSLVQSCPNLNLKRPANIQAGAKSTAASSLKFQAEATAHLQKSGVPRTNDAPKYDDEDVQVSIADMLRI